MILQSLQSDSLADYSLTQSRAKRAEKDAFVLTDRAKINFRVISCYWSCKDTLKFAKKKKKKISI